MIVFLLNTLIYVFLFLCLCIIIVCLCIFIVPAGTLWLPWMRFPLHFFSFKANCQGKTRKDGARPAFFLNFCVVLCIFFVSFCVLFVCKCVLFYCYRVATRLQLTNIKRRVRPKRCNKLWFIYNPLAQHVSGIILPIFRSARPYITANGFQHLMWWLQSCI